MNDKVIQQWNSAAETYSTDQQDSFYYRFKCEIIQNILPSLCGCRILDAGCGDGCFSKMLQKMGAIVTGCDGSSKMLEIARKNNPSIQFDQVNLLSSLPYEDASFDMVFCNTVLMDLDPIERFVTEASRVLKSDGRFLFSIVHPAFFTGDWEKDEQGRKRSKKMFDYLTCRSEENDFWGPTMHYHRPISCYVNAFTEHGLWVEKMYEPAPSADILIEQYEQLTRIPIFLFVIFRKKSS